MCVDVCVSVAPKSQLLFSKFPPPFGLATSSTSRFSGTLVVGDLSRWFGNLAGWRSRSSSEFAK